MSKIITLMQWGRIVSILFLLLLSSCKNETNDELLLSFISNEERIPLGKIVLIDNSEIKDFFKKRNTKEYSMSYIYSDTISYIPLEDLLTDKDLSKKFLNGKINIKNNLKIDSVLSKPFLVYKNEYIARGKGVSAEVEIFLKDSFNYSRKDSWKLNKSILLKDSILLLSKPVYNLSKNKAILYISFIKGTKKGYQKIYFMKKYKEKWNVVFEDSIFYHGGIRRMKAN